MRWVKMPVELQHLTFSQIEKAIFHDLLMYQDYETGEIRSKVTSLATTHGVSKNKVTRFLATLIASKLVRKTTQKRTGRNVYFWVLTAPMEQLCDPKPTQSVPKADPINKKDKKEENKNIVSVQNLAEKIYIEYPKKVGRSVGIKKLTNYLLTNPESFNMILEASKTYSKVCKINGTASKFIKQFSTWVNQQCWDDILDIPDPVDIDPQTLPMAEFKKAQAEFLAKLDSGEA